MWESSILYSLFTSALSDHSQFVVTVATLSLKSKSRSWGTRWAPVFHKQGTDHIGNTVHLYTDAFPCWPCGWSFFNTNSMNPFFFFFRLWQNMRNKKMSSCDHFKVYNSVTLSTFPVWCSHPHQPYLEFFPHPELKLYSWNNPHSSLPSSLATSVLLSVSISLPVLGISYK